MRIAEIYYTLQGEGRLTGVQSVFVRASGCNLRCCFCDTPYASWKPEGDYLSVEQVVAEVERCASSHSNGQPGGGKGDSPIFAATTLRAVPEIGTVPQALRHVVITGGEPMLFPDLVPLCAELRRRAMHVTIETAGTRYLPVQCDLMAVSPKLSNSTPRAGDRPDFRVSENGTVPFDAVERPAWVDLHERNRTALWVVRRLNAEYDCQFKFVVGSPADCDEVTSYLASFPEIDRQRVLLMPQGTQSDELTAIGQWLEPYCQEQGLVFCPRRQIEWFGCCRGT